MDTTVCLAEEPEQQFCTISPSPKVVVKWDSNTVYCGFRTAYKVILTGVTGGTMVKLFFRTNDGKLLDEIAFYMDSVVYVDKVLIPFNVAAGTTIYIEIQLPEYNVVFKSDCKPVYNSIPKPKKVSSHSALSFLQVKSWAKRLLNFNHRHQSIILTGPLYPPLSQVRPCAERQI